MLGCYVQKMKLVIDQNSLRSSGLRSFLESSDENTAVITDMAMFEMLKGGDPVYVAKQSTGVLSDFPKQVVSTYATGELMRQELSEGVAIESLIDSDTTSRMQLLLSQINDFNNGRRSSFPLNRTDILEARSTALSQRLNHSSNKSNLDGGVDVLRTHLSPELQKDIRAERLTKGVYSFAYQTGFLAFRDAVEAEGFNLSDEELQALYLDNCFTSRYSIIYTLSNMTWFAQGGAESMPSEKVTNDLHDIDYLLISSYFDGIMSKEKRVNKLYDKMKLFFEFKSTV